MTLKQLCAQFENDMTSSHYHRYSFIIIKKQEDDRRRYAALKASARTAVQFRHKQVDLLEYDDNDPYTI